MTEFPQLFGNWRLPLSDLPPLDPSTLEPATVQKGPLEGLRVLDAATMMAGPWAATYLADYGADVVKVELPGKGDPVRHWGSQVKGTSLAWKGLARNKRLVTLAMNTPEGQALLLRMVPHFDVLVENYRPGVMERWGLGPEQLHEANPRLIILRTSGYGQTGPYAPKPGFGTLAEAFAGLAFVSGAEDRAPSISGYPLADGVTALAGAMAAPIDATLARIGCEAEFVVHDMDLTLGAAFVGLGDRIHRLLRRGPLLEQSQSLRTVKRVHKRLAGDHTDTGFDRGHPCAHCKSASGDGQTDHSGFDIMGDDGPRHLNILLTRVVMS